MPFSFAQLKKSFKLGDTVTLTATNLPQAQKLLCIPRAVSIVQTNAIALKTEKEGGKVVNSWLYFPSKVSLVKIINEKNFTFCDEYGGELTYQKS